MNQQERFQAIVDRAEARLALEPVTIDPELAEPRSFLKVLKARHYNWTGPRFTKVFGMRFDVTLPPLEQLNTIFYPRPEYDVPIFIFFCLETKRKLIAHLNVNCPFDDEQYRSRWVTPLVEILHRYPAFECPDRYPEWMKKYRNDCTIYGMFTRDRGEDIENCALDYLDFYLDEATRAQPVAEADRLAQIARFQDQFRDDIRTQDKAQKMIAKMIGADKARRIFYEVTT